MIEELLKLDVTNLKPRKIKDILAPFEYEDADETPEKKEKYDVVFSYLNAVKAAQTASSYQQNGKTKENVLAMIVAEIRTLTSDKTPGIFNNYAEYNGLKELIKAHDASSSAVNQASQNVFVWVFKLIELIFKIKDPDRKAAMQSLSKILNHLNTAYKEFRSVEEFTTVLSKLWGTHLDAKATDLAGQKIQAAAKRELTASEQVSNAERAAEAARSALKSAEVDLQTAQARFQEEEARRAAEVVSSASTANGKSNSIVSFSTLHSQRIQSGVAESNPTDDSHKMIMFGGWTQAQATLVIYLRYEYNLHVVNETTKARIASLPGHAGANGRTHRDFVGKEELMSAKILALIVALADEEKTPKEIIAILNSREFKSLDVTKRLARVQDGAWFNDIDEKSKLPGFAVKPSASAKSVKEMYYKIAKLGNMWGDEENTSMLPYNEAKSDYYIDIALQMEGQYSFIEKLTEGRLAEQRRTLAHQAKKA